MRSDCRLRGDAMNSRIKMSSIARKINLDFWFKRLWDVIRIDILLVLLLGGGAFLWWEESVPDTEKVISRDFVAVDNGEEYVLTIDENGFNVVTGSNEADDTKDVVTDSNKVDNPKDVVTDSGEADESQDIVIDSDKEKDSVLDDLDNTGRTVTDVSIRGKLTYVINTDKGQYIFYLYDIYLISHKPFMVLFILQGVHLVFALFGAGSIRRRMRPLNDLARKAEEISRIPLDTTSKFENLEHAISNISPDGENMRVKTGDKELESIEIALNNLLYRMKESQKQQARFVSDASHELRTPISVVQGYVNMLDRWGEEDPAILDEAIEALKHESDHMKELIEQLLFLARGDSGRNTLNKISVDLNEIMKEVWEESEMIDSKHTYEFEECQGALMTGDVAMVKQSVRIFVQNAAKYSNEGDNIKLGVRINPDSVSYLVQDEGIGMQEEDVSHIFERFYRSDKARNGETGGSGLGLSIAKWIIDAHDGTIEVLSRPDIGTRFTVTFPRKMNIASEEE